MVLILCIVMLASKVEKKGTTGRGLIEEVDSFDESNAYRMMAESRKVDELSHGHLPGYSDGSNPISDRLYEAVRNGIVNVAFTDHADATGISGQSHQGYYGEEWFQDPEMMEEGIENVIHDEDDDTLLEYDSFDVRVAVGMELDFDIDNRGVMRDYLQDKLLDGPLDMVLLAAHYDRDGRNVGNASDYGPGTDTDQVLQEYYQQILPAAAELADEFPQVTTLVHWDRPEGNPVLADDITVEMYEDALAEIERKDVVLEYNTKTGLRNILNQGHPTLGSQVLLSRAEQFSGGTDTHRVGRSDKVDYKVDETEQRLQELERVAEETGRMVSVMEDLDLREARLPLSSNVFTQRENFLA